MMLSVTPKGGKEQDISKLVKTKTWSGDYKQAARQLTFSVANTPTDFYLPKISIPTGSMIRLFDDTPTEIFRGYSFQQERNRSNMEISITAFDGMTYLARNKATYNFKNMTPSAIASKICADFGIPVGHLEAPNVRISQIFKGESLYDIIMKCYTKAAAITGKKYMLVMNQGKFNVQLKGRDTTRYFASSTTNISEASFTESIDGMVNRVKIYDDKNRYIGMAQNAADITNYGLLQDVYEKQDKVNPTAAAKAMLKAIERSGKITCVHGDTTCVTGNAIKVKEPFTGLTGLFYIDTDSHTFENGQHTMELTLDFQNIMNEVS